MEHRDEFYAQASLTIGTVSKLAPSGSIVPFVLVLKRIVENNRVDPYCQQQKCKVYMRMFSNVM